MFFKFSGIAALGLGIGHVTMKTRTVQDLLAERRYNALEAHRETCPTAIAMLEAHIAMIDTEIESRRETTEATS